MKNGRIPRRELEAAAERLIQTVRWQLMRRFIETGMTYRELARRVQRPQSWVHKNMMDVGGLGSVAELCYGLDCHPEFKLYPREGVLPKDEHKSFRRWPMFKPILSCVSERALWYALGPVEWKEAA
jgi:hypothetical protein